MKLYATEVEKAVQRIEKIQAKIVCIQLPDGMKPYAKEIEYEISQRTGA